MDVMRAKQILESPREIDVRHDGVPVWIQQVNEDAETARVYPRAHPENEKTVPVEQLEEY
ncbi:small, acid-soluble spore protein H [Marinithermofilum abyssi]|jgi:small acid-soluble spore protein H (minor)|uniref:Small, acid-soluble spore protein H n=1 Tax=Marinithermofilum abyssi TaxID=1571185 RepID=A0A8J2VGM8_9BACL|nr:H-type small acid-soluble spore protein [Marinithermofilum abyssi]GGE10523.1 small, acid-soluble spore protein H [Marinithermofilum abyssi]